MPRVYSIRDMKDGKQCQPYIKVQNVLKPKKSDCLNPVDAKLRYIKSLETKLAQTKKL